MVPIARPSEASCCNPISIPPVFLVAHQQRDNGPSAGATGAMGPCPGTHVDLIGANKPDMREADGDLISNASLFVDRRETKIHHIGELMMSLANGVFAGTSVVGDLYDLAGRAVIWREKL